MGTITATSSHMRSWRERRAPHQLNTQAPVEEGGGVALYLHAKREVS